jgi:hypothetical protein
MRHDSIDDRETVALEADNTDRRSGQHSEQFNGIMSPKKYKK